MNTNEGQPIVNQDVNQVVNQASPLVNQASPLVNPIESTMNTATLTFPTTQNAIATYMGVSKQTISKLFKKISDEHTKLGLDFIYKDNSGLVTEHGFDELKLCQEIGLSEYRNRLEQTPIPSLTSALTLLGDVNTEIIDSEILDIAMSQTNRLNMISEQSQTEIESTLDTYLNQNQNFFATYLQSGIEIGQALGAKKASLTVQAMQQTEIKVMNELLKKQALSLG